MPFLSLRPFVQLVWTENRTCAARDTQKHPTPPHNVQIFRILHKYPNSRPNPKPKFSKQELCVKRLYNFILQPKFSATKSLRMRASEISLVCRAITANSSHERGIFTSSFSFSCHKFSTASRTDSICINELDETVFLIRKMMRVRPQPSVFELTKQLQVIVKMKQYSVALKLFDEMRQWAGFLKHGYEANVTTFNTLLKGLFLDGNVAEAEKLFKKILTLKLCQPDDVTILTVIDGLCKAGRVHTARDLLLLLEKTIYKPSVKAYSAVIDCLCKGGMVDNALELLFAHFLIVLSMMNS
ncbi:PREDICTED: putative pentatricopeptide repeat-containing protein At1g12700, mitochondrial [Erythranthe guttata]|uniref:putative pentatricopeptide repeat-containing protein At1g12700, mitochondrial n=1 Tax=Erythranthe guttata TaxID=4155 RepID=UPI00064D76C8|nr:PREDICTED: putative pentatricopeptide repeat-containing protein At1g12700, mitochondrial [Erythranthe guttata]|eukprot:XP_012854407.1 PREDICTED: putative pentatricopeptide repeat-containing protein At1g12700, mitochondrial [Erythranthe guttata]